MIQTSTSACRIRAEVVLHQPTSSRPGRGQKNAAPMPRWGVPVGPVVQQHA